MPLNVDIRAGLIYLLLLVAIPIQLYLSNQNSVPAGQREAKFRSLVRSVSDFYNNHLTLSAFESKCIRVFAKAQEWATGKRFTWFQDSDEGECPAYEVYRFLSPRGYFGYSATVRSPRPASVKLRVGQVIRNKEEGYRGVIVAWDSVAKAPEAWLDYTHPPSKMHWRTMPNYAILVDLRDEPRKILKYAPQEALEVLSHTEIVHPNVQDYFDGFDGAQYIMRPALKHLYPHD